MVAAAGWSARGVISERRGIRIAASGTKGRGFGAQFGGSGAGFSGSWGEDLI